MRINGRGGCFTRFNGLEFESGKNNDKRFQIFEDFLFQNNDKYRIEAKLSIAGLYSNWNYEE